MPLALNGCTLDELLIAALSREVHNDQVVAIGGSSPLLTAVGLLAQASHAPAATMLYLGAEAYWPFHNSSKEVLDLGQRGLFDVFLLPAPKVDGRGVTAYENDYLSGRFPGGLGTRRLYHLAQRAILYAETHSTTVLVPKVEPTPDTGPPILPMGVIADPSVLYTPLCVFSFEEGAWTLRSLHPGVTPDDIATATGFDYRQAASVPPTWIPDPATLQLLRTRVRSQLALRYGEFARTAFFSRSSV